ncbi:MAG: serine acetyltransferase [Clostridia bacterium]|nr:serine acetyltransferase [Clostridia bacterium]
MIKSKSDYEYYLNRDFLALFGKDCKKNKRYLKLTEGPYQYQLALRKCEYFKNCKKGIFSKIHYVFLKMKLRKLRFKYSLEIPENVCEDGLSIAHTGGIVINSSARIGKNCRIHVGVNIGCGARGEGVPTIGNNCYIGPGAKLFGNIVIGDNTVIGANAVVNKSFPEGNMTIGGIPAKKISDKTSEGIIDI